jgi:hypothetical protein
VGLGLAMVSSRKVGAVGAIRGSGLEMGGNRFRGHVVWLDGCEEEEIEEAGAMEGLSRIRLDCQRAGSFSSEKCKWCMTKFAGSTR